MLLQTPCLTGNFQMRNFMYEFQNQICDFHHFTSSEKDATHSLVRIFASPRAPADTISRYFTSAAFCELFFFGLRRHHSDHRQFSWIKGASFTFNGVISLKSDLISVLPEVSGSYFLKNIAMLMARTYFDYCPSNVLATPEILVKLSLQ